MDVYNNQDSSWYGDFGVLLDVKYDPVINEFITHGTQDKIIKQHTISDDPKIDQTKLKEMLRDWEIDKYPERFL